VTVVMIGEMSLDDWDEKRRVGRRMIRMRLTVDGMRRKFIQRSRRCITKRAINAFADPGLFCELGSTDGHVCVRVTVLAMWGQTLLILILVHIDTSLDGFAS